MKRDRHGAATPLAPKQTSKIGGIPFLKCLVLLKRVIFLSISSAEASFLLVHAKEKQLFLFFFFLQGLEVISSEETLGGLITYGKMREEL